MRINEARAARGDHVDFSHDRDTTSGDRPTPANGGRGPGTHGKPATGADITVERLTELLAELTKERAAQGELNEILVQTLRNVIDEQGDVQRELASLWTSIERIAAQHGGPRAPGTGSGPPPKPSEAYRALRAQTLQAQRHSEKLMERAVELAAHTRGLMDDARRVAAPSGAPVPPKRGSGRWATRRNG